MTFRSSELETKQEALTANLKILNQIPRHLRRVDGHNLPGVWIIRFTHLLTGASDTILRTSSFQRYCSVVALIYQPTYFSSRAILAQGEMRKRSNLLMGRATRQKPVQKARSRTSTKSRRYA